MNASHMSFELLETHIRKPNVYLFDKTINYRTACENTVPIVRSNPHVQMSAGILCNALAVLIKVSCTGKIEFVVYPDEDGANMPTYFDLYVF